MRVIQITDVTAVDREVLLARADRAAVQLRDPTLDTRALLELGAELRRRTRLLFVNDRLDVARCLRADGVHLGRRSVSVTEARAFLGDTLVTCSAHSVEDAVRRGEEGADAVLLSPIFLSPGKGEPLGIAALVAARRRMRRDVALVALGGLNVERAREALAAGADGVASIRADLTDLALSAPG